MGKILCGLAVLLIVRLASGEVVTPDKAVELCTKFARAAGRLNTHFVLRQSDRQNMWMVVDPVGLGTVAKDGSLVMLTFTPSAMNTTKHAVAARFVAIQAEIVKKLGYAGLQRSTADSSLGPNLAAFEYRARPYGYAAFGAETLQILLDSTTAEPSALIWKKGFPARPPVIKITEAEAIDLSRRASSVAKGATRIRKVYYPKVFEDGSRELRLSFEIHWESGYTSWVDAGEGKVLNNRRDAKSPS